MRAYRVITNRGDDWDWEQAFFVDLQIAKDYGAVMRSQENPSHPITQWYLSQDGSCWYNVDCYPHISVETIEIDMARLP